MKAKPIKGKKLSTLLKKIDKKMAKNYRKSLPEVWGDVTLANTEQVDIELTDEVFQFLALEAHKKDITFNALCNQILKEYLDAESTDRSY